MKTKGIIAFALSAACLCAGAGTTAYAEAASPSSLVDGISPLNEIACDAKSGITISGASASCVSTAKGDDIIKITVVQTLEKYSGWFWIWNEVDGTSRTNTANNNSIRFTNTHNSLASGTYRVKSVFTLTDKNGKTETVTKYSDEEKVS